MSARTSGLRVAVTGASGFVGTHLVNALVASGHTAIRVSRGGAESGPGELRRVPSYSDAAAIGGALAGVDAVVHLASRVHVMRESEADPEGAFRRANVDSTRVIVEALERKPTARLVFCSTIKVHGEGSELPVTEASPLLPKDAYSRSKVEAEHVVRRLDPHRHSWTVIRPPLVYGPGVGGNFRRLLSLARVSRVLPLPLGGINNRRTMVSADNLVSLIIKSIEDPRASGKVFVAADDQSVSTSELVDKLARLMGHNALMLSLPERVLRACASIGGLEPQIARLTESYVVDAQTARRTLDWSPPKSLDEGLEATVRWWRATVQR